MLDSVFYAIMDATLADIGKFVLSLVAVGVLGFIQYVLAIYFGFGRKSQAIYALEAVGLVTVLLTKGAYLPFAVALPVTLVFATWRAFRLVGTDDVQVVADVPYERVGTRPWYGLPDHVQEALRAPGDLGVYDAEAQLRPLQLKGGCTDMKV